MGHLVLHLSLESLSVGMLKDLYSKYHFQIQFQPQGGFVVEEPTPLLK